MDPRDVPPVVIQESVLKHCGQRMMVYGTRRDGAFRIRYCKCRKCGATGKTIDEPPQPRSAPPTYPAGGGPPRHCGREMQDRGQAVFEERKLCRSWRCSICGKEIAVFVRYLRPDLEPDPLLRRSLGL